MILSALDYIWKPGRKFKRLVDDGNPLRSSIELALYVLLAMTLHVVAMMYFEAMSLIDAIWLTFTTITTVGYGDLAAKTLEGRLCTIVLLYIGGIFILGKAFSDAIDYKAMRQERMARGEWRWKMKDHLLIIGSPLANPTQYFGRLVDQVRQSKTWHHVPIQLLTMSFEGQALPQILAERGVAHIHGKPTKFENMDATCPKTAKAVIILAENETDNASDGKVFDVIHRIREYGFNGQIIAECVDEANRDRFIKAGATNIVRPMRGYPEMLIRALISPGSEMIIEELFESKGDECHRVDVEWSGKWSSLIQKLAEAEVGIPVAYADESKEIVTNPRASTFVDATALFVIVHEDHKDPVHEVLKALT